MAALHQLDAYLAGNSYLGSATCATLEDYKHCEKIKASDIDATKFPNLARWHAHVTHLAAKYPKFDWRGDAVPAGKAPAFGEAPVKAATNGASPKKEAAPKKEQKQDKKKGAAEEKAAPEPAAEDPEKARKDKLKKVIKEGGKRGVEIEGAADMGGLQFFCCSVDCPEGDLELLVESMKAMNVKSDPTEEERKGGSGHIGKMVFSAGPEQLAVVAYVPEEKLGEVTSEDWLKTVLGNFGGKVVQAGKGLSTGCVKTDSDKNVFPLKIREPMILEANNFLRKKGLFPDNDSDDDDEMVFGDDDFPS